MNGRKIEVDYENPIDSILIELSEPLVNILYKLNITPNMVTIFRLVFILLQINNLYHNRISINSFVLSYIFYYYLDCADGYMARKFNMTSIIGDLLDHFTDMGVSLLLFYLFLYNKMNNYGYLILLIILFLSMYHLGCQELYNEKNNTVLGIFKCLCSSKESIYMSKYFGCGTYNIIFLILFYYYYVN
jgi:phosphatidylglycerophosphate synthase